MKYSQIFNSKTDLRSDLSVKLNNNSLNSVLLNYDALNQEIINSQFPTEVFYDNTTKNNTLINTLKDIYFKGINMDSDTTTINNNTFSKKDYPEFFEEATKYNWVKSFEKLTKDYSNNTIKKDFIKSGVRNLFSNFEQKNIANTNLNGFINILKETNKPVIFSDVEVDVSDMLLLEDYQPIQDVKATLTLNGIYDNNTNTLTLFDYNTKKNRRVDIIKPYWVSLFLDNTLKEHGINLKHNLFKLNTDNTISVDNDFVALKTKKEEPTNIDINDVINHIINDTEFKADKKQKEIIDFLKNFELRDWVNQFVFTKMFEKLIEKESSITDVKEFIETNITKPTNEKLEITTNTDNLNLLKETFKNLEDKNLVFIDFETVINDFITSKNYPVKNKDIPTTIGISVVDNSTKNLIIEHSFDLTNNFENDTDTIIKNFIDCLDEIKKQIDNPVFVIFSPKELTTINQIYNNFNFENAGLSDYKEKLSNVITTDKMEGLTPTDNVLDLMSIGKILYDVKNLSLSKALDNIDKQENSTQKRYNPILNDGNVSTIVESTYLNYNNFKNIKKIDCKILDNVEEKNSTKETINEYCKLDAISNQKVFDDFESKINPDRVIKKEKTNQGITR